MRWNGSVVLITGASRGIGRAVAQAASARGAKVGLVARGREDLERLRASLTGDTAIATADVAVQAEVERAFGEIGAALGPVDILVNNAGIGHYGAFADAPVDVLEKMMRVNYLGCVYAMKAVLPQMIERRRGHIVQLASIAGRIGAPFEAGYSASKFALVGLSEAVAIELSNSGVRMSIVNPGPVDTDFFEARGTPYQMKTPKPVSPERVAAAVIAAVERNRLEQYVPRWLRQANAIKAVVPPLYQAGTKRTFRETLKRDATVPRRNPEP